MTKEYFKHVDSDDYGTNYAGENTAKHLHFDYDTRVYVDDAAAIATLYKLIEEQYGWDNSHKLMFDEGLALIQSLGFDGLDIGYCEFEEDDDDDDDDDDIDYDELLRLEEIAEFKTFNRADKYRVLRNKLQSVHQTMLSGHEDSRTCETHKELIEFWNLFKILEDDEFKPA
jgi:hypothetical protein